MSAVARSPRRRATTAGMTTRWREIRQIPADVVEHLFVVFGEVVDHPAGQRDAGSAQVFLGDLFARRLFHDGRARGEDRALAAHDREVAHRCHKGAVAGGRAEQSRHGRNLAGALRLREQVGGGAAVVLAAWAESGPFEKHYQRDPVAQRQLGKAVPLGVAARPDAAGQRGEVLRPDHDRCPVYLS